MKKSEKKSAKKGELYGPIVKKKRDCGVGGKATRGRGRERLVISGLRVKEKEIRLRRSNGVLTKSKKENEGGRGGGLLALMCGETEK